MSKKILTKKLLNQNMFLLSMLVFAFLLQLLFLFDAPILHDEPYRLFWAENEEEFAKIMLADVHPPFIYKFSNWVYHLVGDSVARTRLVFIPIGLLNLFLTYKLAKRFKSEKIALLLASTSFYFISFSVRISPYTMVSAATTGSILFLMRFYEKKDTLSLVLLGAVWGIGMNIHYYTLLIIIPQLLLILYLTEGKQKMRCVLVPSLVAFIIFLPTLNLAIQQFMNALSRTENQEYSWALARPRVEPLRIVWTAGMFYPSHGMGKVTERGPGVLYVAISLYFLYTIMLAKLLMGLKKHKFIFRLKKPENRDLFILLGSFFGYVFMLTIGNFLSVAYFLPRYFSVVYPAYITIMSIGLLQIKNKKLRFTMLGLALLFSLAAIWLSYLDFPIMERYESIVT
ncbi:MAG: glycosyltransferase family 39 protein [Candidatus Hadarchaeales archaeon]